MDAKGTKETADVIPDRLGAQVELVCDLLRRVPLLQKSKHLDEPWGEMGVRRCRLFLGAALEEPEDADHPFALHERHRADFHDHPRAGGRNQDAGRVCGRGRAQHLPREQLTCAAAVLGRDDGGEVATANIADKPFGCSIHPPYDSRPVEDIARDTDPVQSLLDVAADSQAAERPGHAESVSGQPEHS